MALPVRTRLQSQLQWFNKPVGCSDSDALCQSMFTFRVLCAHSILRQVGAPHMVRTMLGKPQGSNDASSPVTGDPPQYRVLPVLTVCFCREAATPASSIELLPGLVRYTHGMASYA